MASGGSDVALKSLAALLQRPCHDSGTADRSQTSRKLELLQALRARRGANESTSTNLAAPVSSSENCVRSHRLPVSSALGLSAPSSFCSASRAPVGPSECRSGSKSSAGSRSVSKSSPAVGAADALIRKLEKARIAGVDQHEIQEVEHLLAEEHEVVCLEAAIASGDRHKLAAAIAEARHKGVGARLIDKAQTQCLQFEAYELMEKAIAAKNPTQLHAAIVRARVAHVGKEDLHAAEHMLKQIEAHERLRVSMDTGEIEAVRWALGEAKRYGLAEHEAEDPLVGEARQVVKTLSHKRSAHKRGRTCGHPLQPNSCSGWEGKTGAHPPLANPMATPIDRPGSRASSRH